MVLSLWCLREVTVSVHHFESRSPVKGSRPRVFRHQGRPGDSVWTWFQYDSAVGWSQGANMMKVYSSGLRRQFNYWALQSSRGQSNNYWNPQLVGFDSAVVHQSNKEALRRKHPSTCGRFQGQVNMRSVLQTAGVKVSFPFRFFNKRGHFAICQRKGCRCWTAVAGAEGIGAFKTCHHWAGKKELLKRKERTDPDFLFTATV